MDRSFLLNFLRSPVQLSKVENHFGGILAFKNKSIGHLTISQRREQIVNWSEIIGARVLISSVVAVGWPVL